MLKNRFSPALLALLVAIGASGSVYAADMTSEKSAIETPVIVSETVVLGEEAQTPATETPAAIEAPAVETPAAEMPAADDPEAIEIPDAEVPAAQTPEVVEAPAVETPAAEAPAVETPAPVSEPVAAMLTITHRLMEGDQYYDMVEVVDGLEVGQTVDLSQYVKAREGITCISTIENLSLAEAQNTIVLEYQPCGDEPDSSAEANE